MGMLKIIIVRKKNSLDFYAFLNFQLISHELSKKSIKSIPYWHNVSDPFPFLFHLKTELAPSTQPKLCVAALYKEFNATFMGYLHRHSCHLKIIV